MSHKYPLLKELPPSSSFGKDSTTTTTTDRYITSSASFSEYSIHHQPHPPPPHHQQNSAIVRGLSFDCTNTVVHPKQQPQQQQKQQQQQQRQSVGLFHSSHSFDTAITTSYNSHPFGRRLFETSKSDLKVGDSIFRRLASTDSTSSTSSQSSSSSSSSSSLSNFGQKMPSYKNYSIPKSTYTSPPTSPTPPQCTRHSHLSIPKPQPPPPEQTTREDTEEQNSLIPRRNLTDAFESMAVVSTDTNTTTATPKQMEEEKKVDPSPAGVNELEVKGSSTPPHTMKSSLSTWEEQPVQRITLPTFMLYPALQRNLTQSTLNRVSFYGVIHDINKEATGMAANDPLNQDKEDKSEEERCPLVIAVNGPPKSTHQEEKNEKSSALNTTALIDEEQWLLTAIASRTPQEISHRPTPTSSLAVALGEQEPAENTQQTRSSDPLSDLSSSRTQLWKPSRSWWEAKSGKNPWIEPLSHNKRWRFLWPLIHYHKFLAKCIKKLKRNGVDVKGSISPVPVFLREEVCAVSDHLAELSKFTSEEWMESLRYFHGWTGQTRENQEELRALVGRCRLRSCGEVGDLESPLLRDQIDETFLRAMKSQRDLMVNGAFQQGGKGSGKGYVQPYPDDYRYVMPPSYPAPPLPHYPPLPPQGPILSKPKHKRNSKRTNQRNFDRYTHAGRGYNWNRPPPYGAEKHYGMYPPPYGNGMYGDGHYGHYYPNMHHAPSLHQQHHHMGSAPHSEYFGQNHGYAPAPGYHPDHMAPYHEEVGSDLNVPPHYGAAHPQMAYPPTPNTPVGPHGVGVPSTPQALPNQQTVPTPLAEAVVAPQNEHVVQTQPQAAMSPYWGHLDQTTLAMSGLMTPAGKGEVPMTPHRSTGVGGEEGKRQLSFDGVDGGKGQNAQPLLMNPSAQYYTDHQHGAPGANVPPSPATQFLMAPQGNWAQNQAHTNPSFFGHVPGSPYVERMGQHLSSIPDENAVTHPATQEACVEGGDVEAATKEASPPPVVRKMASTGESSDVKSES